MKPSIQKISLASAIILALTSSASFATNGLAPAGLGQVHKAMGGTSVGNPVNTMSMATNPAAASFIDNGFDVGLEIFSPDRTATVVDVVGVPDAGKAFDGNDTDNFLIPEGGYKRSLSDKHAVGITVYGNGGMNTDYGINPGFGTGKTGVDLQQLIISPTWAMKFDEDYSVGVSVNLAYQKFKVEGIQNFSGISSSPAHVSNNGYGSSTGVGATIGFQGKIADDMTVGIAYKSKIKMGKIDKYKGLLPDQGALDMPATLSVGMAWQASPKTQIAMDATHIYYADVAATGNSSQVPLPLGSDDAAGFGWTNQSVYKIGVKQQINPNLALMAGYNHGNSPVSAGHTNFNVLAPAVVEDHATLGFEYKINEKSSVTGSYVHTFANTVKADISQLQAYDLDMSQDAIGIGYSKKF
jgi:long-chain fatty acid transport protein